MGPVHGRGWTDGDCGTGYADGKGVECAGGVGYMDGRRDEGAKGADGARVLELQRC